MTGPHKGMKAHSFHPTWDNSEWTWQPQSFIWGWLRPWKRLHHSPILLSSFPFHRWQSERGPPTPINLLANLCLRLPRWLISKESTCDAEDAGDPGSIPGGEDPLEEGLATHSSILAWRVPKDREAWQVPAIGLQRVRHNWSDWACISTHYSSHSLLLRELQFVTHSFLNNVQIWVWYCCYCC